MRAGRSARTLFQGLHARERLAQPGHSLTTQETQKLFKLLVKLAEDLHSETGKLDTAVSQLRTAFLLCPDCRCVALLASERASYISRGCRHKHTRSHRLAHESSSDLYAIWPANGATGLTADSLSCFSVPSCMLIWPLKVLHLAAYQLKFAMQV